MREARRGDGLPLRGQRAAPRRGVEAPPNDFSSGTPMSRRANDFVLPGSQGPVAFINRSNRHLAQQPHFANYLRIPPQLRRSQSRVSLWLGTPFHKPRDTTGCVETVTAVALPNVVAGPCACPGRARGPAHCQTSCNFIIPISSVCVTVFMK